MRKTVQPQQQTKSKQEAATRMTCNKDSERQIQQDVFKHYGLFIKQLWRQQQPKQAEAAALASVEQPQERGNNQPATSNNGADNHKQQQLWCQQHYGTWKR